MGIENTQQLLANVKAGKISLESLSDDDYKAVKSLAASNISKTSAQQPLVATKQGQKKLKQQAKETIALQKQHVDFKPPPAPMTQGTANVMNAAFNAASQVQSQPEQPKTWSQQFAEAYPTLTNVLGKGFEYGDKLAGYTTGLGIRPSQALGVLGSAASDIIGNATDVNNQKLSADVYTKAGQAMADFARQNPIRSIVQPGSIINAGLESVNENARPWIDTTKNIYALGAMSQGASPQLSAKMAEEAVRQNPNLYGTSANLFGATLDPLNAAGAGGFIKNLINPRKAAKLAELVSLGREVGNESVGALPKGSIDVTPFEYGQPYNYPLGRLPEGSVGSKAYAQADQNRFPAQPFKPDVANTPVITTSPQTSAWREKVGQEARNTSLGLPAPVMTDGVPKKQGVKVLRIDNSPKAIQQHYQQKMDQLAAVLAQKYPNIPTHLLTQQEIEGTWNSIADKTDPKFDDAMDLAYPESGTLQKQQVQKVIDKFGNVDAFNEAIQKGRKKEPTLKETAEEPQSPLIFKTQRTKFLPKGSFAQQVEQDLAPKAVEEKAATVTKSQTTPIEETKPKPTRTRKAKEQPSKNLVNQVGNDLGATPVQEEKPKPKKGRKPKPQPEGATKPDLASQVGDDLSPKPEQQVEIKTKSVEQKKKSPAKSSQKDVWGRAPIHRTSDNKSPIVPGDTFETVSGGATTPYPNYSKGKASGLDIYNSNKWLIENALNEARLRGNKQAEISLKSALDNAEKAKNKELAFTQSDKDFAHMYLFDKESLKIDKPTGTLKNLSDRIGEDLSPKPEQQVETKSKPAQTADEKIRARNAKAAERESSKMGIVSGTVSAPKPREGHVRASNVNEALTSTKTVGGVAAQLKNRFILNSQRVIDGLKEVVTAFKPFGKIKSNLIKEILHDGESENMSSLSRAIRDVKNIFMPIGTKYERNLFRDILYLRDYEETKLNNPKAKVPGDLSLDEIQKELKHLEQNELPKYRSVQDALDNYYDKMKEVYDKLVEIGKLPKDENPRKYYVPHKVLKYYAENVPNAAGKRLDTAFRTYALKRSGESKELIETNIVKVLEDFFTKYHSDNAIESTLNKVIKESDALDGIDVSKVASKSQRRAIREAIQANAPTKERFIKEKIADYVDEGISEENAKEYAELAWKARTKNTSTVARFHIIVSSILKKEGLSGDALDAVTKLLWKEVAEKPAQIAKRLDGTKITYDGHEYVLMNPRYTDKIHLISKEVYDEMQKFGTPLFESAIGRGVNRLTNFFKSGVMIPTTPARVTIDAISNATKLADYDIKALNKKYFGSAVRTFFKTSSWNDTTFMGLNKVAKWMSENAFGKPTQLDADLLDFARKHNIIEPVQQVRGTYRFTPFFEKLFRRVMGLGVYSRNASQRVDEFFKLWKSAVDIERVQNGEMAKWITEQKSNRGAGSRKPIRDQSGLIDISDLTPEIAASKIAKEFFVNPNRQSRFMRKYFTSLIAPFIHWTAMDSIHRIRYVKAHPAFAALKILGVAAGFEAWNNTGERKKYEQGLSPAKRAIPHLVTGYVDASGQPYVLYFPTFAGNNLFQATGLAQVPQQVSDYMTGQKDAKKAIDDLIHNSKKAIVQNTTGYVSPYLRTGMELYANKNMYTGLPAIPQGSTGTWEGVKKGVEYATKQIIPTYRNISTATDSPDVSLGQSLGKMINPVGRILKPEDLKKEAKVMFYDLKDRDTIQKKESKQDVRDAFANYLVNKDIDSLRKSVIASGLSGKSINSYVNTNMVTIISLAMKKTKDPAKIQELQKMLDAYKQDAMIGDVKSLSPENVQQGFNLYQQSSGGK